MNIKSRKQIAIETFRSGMNCAQSILSAYSDDFDLGCGASLELASGFGAGMGRLQKTCGAVTGSFMVIGINNSRNIPDDNIRASKTPDMIQSFNNEFIKRNRTTNCSELLNCDLNTEAGQELFKKNNLGEEVCQKCIGDSIEIIEDIIES